MIAWLSVERRPTTDDRRPLITDNWQLTTSWKVRLMTKRDAPLILTAIMALAAVTLAGAARAGAAPTPQAASVQRNVTYCTAGGVDLKMDVYPPSAASKK